MSDTGMGDKVVFTLDGSEVAAAPGETIWRVAERQGIEIPHLCYSTAATYRADGNCRVCMVEIEGERVLAASCIRTPTPGMVVRTDTTRADATRRMVMELLLADQPARESAHDPNSELWHWADAMGQLASRFPARAAPAPDPSHPAMAVNLDACIHCTLCVRACRESQVNDVIGMAYRGHRAKVVF
ncbi:MAG: 2Fe-2S iron-sulfur cluster-binding protein, partial [Alphaproteobacteria bacterium]